MAWLLDRSAWPGVVAALALAACAAAAAEHGLVPKRITLPTGVSLSYVEAGPADSAAVILLHGLGDSWRVTEGLRRGGHFLPVERPQRMLVDLLEFLSADRWRDRSTGGIVPTRARSRRPTAFPVMASFTPRHGPQ
jgi:hypothetical protein